MNGKELKEILRKEGINLAQLATLLGYSNDQRLHSALKAEDVKSGLIESIARVTNKSVGYYYRECANTANASDNSLAVAGHTNTVNISRDSVKVGGNVSGSIQHGGNLSEIVEKLVNELAEQRRELAEQRRASNRQLELINTLIEKLITDKKT